MGKKSDKKVKSERVNALRKQYDAFLEEDKKRKERNEYILGRLDNMRYSSTALQVRHKPIVYGDITPVYSRITYRPQSFEQRDIQAAQASQTNSNHHQNLQVDVPRKYVADTSSLLKEITKKYILIPKLRPSLTDEFIGTIGPQSLPTIPLSAPNTNVTNKEDWKSKYDILEKLKNNEKEEPVTKYSEIRDEVLPVKESQILSKNGNTDVSDTFEQGIDNYDTQNTSEAYDLESYTSKENTTKYEHELPEKDTTHSKTNESESRSSETFKTSDNKEQEPGTDHAPVRSASIHNEPEINVTYAHTLKSQQFQQIVLAEHNSNIKNAIPENTQHYPEENLGASVYNPQEIVPVYSASEQQISEVPHQQEYPVDHELPALDEGKQQFDNSENVYLDPDEYSPSQGFNPTELVDEFIKEDEPVLPTEEVDEYPMEMINVQNFTPNADVKLEDGVNVNPNYMTEENPEPVYETNPLYDINSEYDNQGLGSGIQEVEAPVDNSGIDEFNAEQSEMFYSQDTEAFAYNQEADENYTTTEGYPQTEDYTAYENTAGLQEQEYPVEINEHEETSSRYDPQYEQQYSEEYQQQQYDQNQGQEYVQPVEGYEQPQEQYQDYGYEQPDSETVQNVEQVLDGELGYNTEQIKGEDEDVKQAA